jgi:hypothetical protein
MEVGMRLMDSSRSLLGSSKILLKSIWRWVIGIRAPIVTASCELPGEEIVAVATTEVVAHATAEVIANPTIEVVASPTTEVIADQTTEIRPETRIKSAVPSAIDEGEIQRRRNLVRTFFNDFWTGAYEKPAGFLERLDRAEDYVNGRLTASGEAWRLDSKTRVMLGLPSRVNSAGPR